jgi:transposase
MGFKCTNREQNFLFPKCIDDYVPDNHLCKFIVRIVDKLDLSKIVSTYSGNGKEAYHPSLMFSLLIYAYSTGTFSSRAIELKTHTDLAYIYICCNTKPDHSTISDFRKRFAPQIADLFLQILEIAKKMGFLKSGTVYIDETKIKANASKHHAYSYLRAKEIKKKLEQEVQDLIKMAEEADNISENINFPDELLLRKDKISVLNETLAELERRAAIRFNLEKEAYEAKLHDREEKFKETGKKTRGKPPFEPIEGPRDKDQINLTDPESRVMPNSDKSFSQAYNAQASVDAESMLIIGTHISQNTNDKKEIEPALNKFKKLPETIGIVTKLVADTGYFSAKNIQLCEENNIDPYIAVNRGHHHMTLEERFSTTAADPCEDASPVEKMRNKLKTETGKAIYKLRKQVVEPVFGVLKSILGFRQFSLRGANNADDEFQTVCMSYNLKKLHKLSYKLRDQKTGL